MGNKDRIKSWVLIVTGFAPIKLPQLAEMGMPTGPISFLSNMAGRSTIQFTIPTIAPAVLATYLAEHGIDVSITDYYIDAETRYDADIVGISSTFMGTEDIKKIVQKIENDNPDAVIVMGGPLSWSLSPAEIFSIVPGIDYLVMREGERTLLELVKAIDSGHGVDKVAGLAYMDGGELKQTALRQGISCQEIRSPKWEIMGIPSARRLPVLPVETSRGCPFNCAYCSEVTYWDKPVRYRPVKAVVEEIVDDIRRLGINTFRFTDSCFSAPVERCGLLCDSIYEKCVAEGITVKWSSYARISNLDYPLLEKMKRSGCVALDIGVESGSMEMLRLMGRNYNPETACNIARFARELGIITNFNVVVGFPGETRSSIERTAELIQKAAPDTFASFQFFMANNTRVDKSFERFHVEGRGLNWRHDTMTSEEAQQGMLEMENSITSAANFPGGEYFSCYLASLGYEVEEIRDFFRNITGLMKFPCNSQALENVGKMVERIRRYW